MPPRRIRKHANPFQVETRLGCIDRAALFGREVPLEVELGPGNCSYLFDRARAQPETDFIGLEVRLPLVQAAMERRAREDVKNIWVFYANANQNLALAEPGVIQRFHIHFPDPCFKRRHWKRRIVQPSTVRAMSTLLPLGGEIYAQSDVKLLAEEMYEFFLLDGALESRLDPSMLVARAFAESTAWERQHEAENEPIYRMLFAKVREPEGPVTATAFRHTDPRKLSPAEAGPPRSFKVADKPD